MYNRALYYPEEWRLRIYVLPPFTPKYLWPRLGKGACIVYTPSLHMASVIVPPRVLHLSPMVFLVHFQSKSYHAVQGFARLDFLVKRDM